MAFTLSTLVNTVYGDQRVKMIRVTADAATGTVATGLRNILAVQESAVSAATRPVLMMNTDASGTAANGTVGVSATASGNVHLLVVHGN